MSSLEIEECLYRHPNVMEAAVVARADPHWGETPCAFVTLKDDAQGTQASDIIAWCREHIAHFKVPKHVVFGPLPKTVTGKIQKYVLRERAREVAPYRARIIRERSRCSASAATRPLRTADSSVAGNSGSV